MARKREPKPKPPPKKKKGQQEGIEKDSWEYYRYCAVGGGFASGFTRLFATPVELAKCRMIANPERYKNISQGISCSYRRGGVPNLFKGWAPTLLGNGIKGAAMFSSYEYFKRVYSDKLGPEDAYTYRTLMYLASAASAGIVASVISTPFESLRIRMQSSACFPTMRDAMYRMRRDEGLGACFRGTLPMMCRQVPYSMMQLALYDRVVESLYKGGWVPKSREQCSLKEQLLVTFIAGTIAGMLASVLSQPFENVLNKLLKEPNTNVKEILKAAGGITGLFAGWGPRFFLVGSMIGMKWLLYDAFKMYFKVPRPPPPNMPASLQKKQQQEQKAAKKPKKKK